MIVEYFVQLLCRCSPSDRPTCEECKGKGFKERWVGYAQLRTLRKWIIVGARKEKKGSL